MSVNTAVVLAIPTATLVDLASSVFERKRNFISFVRITVASISHDFVMPFSGSHGKRAFSATSLF